MKIRITIEAELDRKSPALWDGVAIALGDLVATKGHGHLESDGDAVGIRVRNVKTQTVVVEEVPDERK